MNYQGIYSQLTAGLDALTKPTIVQTENQRVAPDPDEGWWRLTFTPFEPQPASNGMDELKGAFQVSLFIPLDGPVDQLAEWEDAIMALFPRGTLMSSPVHIEIMRSFRGARYGTDNWFGGRVTILWRSMQPRA